MNNEHVRKRAYGYYCMVGTWNRDGHGFYSDISYAYFYGPPSGSEYIPLFFKLLDLV